MTQGRDHVSPLLNKKVQNDLIGLLRWFANKEADYFTESSRSGELATVYRQNNHVNLSLDSKTLSFIPAAADTTPDRLL